MIEMQFVNKKGGERRVFVKDREITLITPEMNYQPLQLTIKQLRIALETGDARIKNALMESDAIDLDKYIDDETIALEILEDFKESGWRCIKKV